MAQIKLLNARQEAKLNSARATEQHVDENINFIKDIPAFLATYNQIKAKIAAITEAAGLKSGSLAGIAAGKSTSRQTLSTKTVAIAGLIYTYAADISDQTLQQEMNITSSRLKRTRDDELAPLCQFVHDRANAHLAALADYGVIAAKLTDLQTAINNYSADVPKPRTAVSSRKTVNANIKQLFRELDELLDRFDRQIESLRETQPDFVNTYFSTREIVDPLTNARKAKDTENNDGGQNG